MYGILRSIESKTYGIILMFLSMLVLFILPILDKGSKRNNH